MELNFASHKNKWSIFLACPDDSKCKLNDSLRIGTSRNSIIIWINGFVGVDLYSPKTGVDNL